MMINISDSRIKSIFVQEYFSMGAVDWKLELTIGSENVDLTPTRFYRIKHSHI